jgi:hypothetical protein
MRFVTEMDTNSVDMERPRSHVNQFLVVDCDISWFHMACDATRQTLVFRVGLACQMDPYPSQ